MQIKHHQYTHKEWSQAKQKKSNKLIIKRKVALQDLICYNNFDMKKELNTYRTSAICYKIIESLWIVTLSMFIDFTLFFEKELKQKIQRCVKKERRRRNFPLPGYQVH